MEQTARERGSDLFEIVQGLHERGKAFESLLGRLTTIGNKLVDESGIESGEKQVALANKPSQPGTISSLQSCTYGFEQLANKFETQIVKLEKII
jgi:hypothetical protein